MSDNTPEPVAPVEAEQTLLPPAPLKRRNAVVELEELPKTLAGPKPPASLVRSIKHLGMLVPVLLAADAKGKYKVIAGRRRIAAAREAELDKIPACVYDVDDLEAGYAELMTLVENEQRSSNAVAEIEALRRLVKGGASEKEIARDCGMPVSRIRARLRIAAGLSEDLWEGMRKGKVSLPVAQAACRMPAKLQKRLHDQLAETGHLALVDVAAIKRVRAAKAAAAIPADAFGDLTETPAYTAAIGALKGVVAELEAVAVLPAEQRALAPEELASLVERVLGVARMGLPAPSKPARQRKSA